LIEIANVVVQLSHVTAADAALPPMRHRRRGRAARWWWLRT
jgi:hypothetical protein